MVCQCDKFTASNSRSREKYFYRLGRSRVEESAKKREREKESDRGVAGLRRGRKGEGVTGMQALKDRNVSGERYLAPPNGQICKLVPGVSLYGKTPRLEGRRGPKEGEGGGFATAVLRRCVYDCTAVREEDREPTRETERERGTRIAEGVAGDQDSEGVARAGPKEGWRGQL